MITPALSAGELQRLSDEDRAMLDAAILQIPPERNPEFVAHMLAIRAIVRHDTAGIHNAVLGVFELQDAADRSARELLDAAHSFRADVAALTSSVAALRADLQAFSDVSSHDRADLRARVGQADRRIAALAALVAFLLFELLYRYGALIAAALLSLVLLLAAGVTS